VGLQADLLEVLTDCHSVVLSLIRKTAQIALFPDLQREPDELLADPPPLRKSFEVLSPPV
jgi:hypothetical protein